MRTPTGHVRCAATANAVVCALLLWSLGGCAPLITVPVLKPAEINVGAYHNVAVVDFEGKQGADISRRTEAALTKVRVNKGEPYFKLVARDQLQKVMKEQSLQLTGAIDPSQAAKVGKVLGVEAIITGNIGAYRTEDSHLAETRSKCSQSGQCYEVQVSCTQRAADVSIAVNFIGVETGVIEVSDSETSNLAARSCQGDGVALPSQNLILQQATDQVIAQFVKKITPHYVTQTVSLKKEDDEAPLFFYSDAERALDDKMKGGLGYAQSGAWRQAVRLWEEAVKQKPVCAACLYNLGFGYEMEGALEKARESYEKAAQLRPTDRNYTNAVARIEGRIQDAETLKAQLQSRGKRKPE